MMIRRTCEADHLTVLALVELAFNGSDEARNVVRLYRAGAEIIDLVAELDGAIVGHVLMSALPSQGPRALIIGGLCVHPFARDQGIASRLLHEGLELAAKEGWSAAYVEGAQAFYRRFGFRPATAAIGVAAFNHNPLQVLELRPLAPAQNAAAGLNQSLS